MVNLRKYYPGYQYPFISLKNVASSFLLIVGLLLSFSCINLPAPPPVWPNILRPSGDSRGRQNKGKVYFRETNKNQAGYLIFGSIAADVGRRGRASHVDSPPVPTGSEFGRSSIGKHSPSRQKAFTLHLSDVLVNKPNLYFFLNRFRSPMTFPFSTVMNSECGRRPEASSHNRRLMVALQQRK